MGAIVTAAPLARWDKTNYLQRLCIMGVGSLTTKNKPATNILNNIYLMTYIQYVNANECTMIFIVQYNNKNVSCGATELA